VLYNFTGPDGSYPYGGVTRDAAGNLYGTTFAGGACNAGVIFKLDTTGHETVLYTFTNGADGGNLWAGVALDSAGNLYGTNNSGSLAVGVIFKLDTAGHLTVLHNFSGGYGGYDSFSDVILDASGNLFGATNSSVYKVDTAGHFKVLYTFKYGLDGGDAEGGLVRDASGNFYGTTAYGGSAGAGVVYKLDASGHETVLYNFTGGADGGQPFAGVTRDAAGNLYGTTATGGAGVGVVYRLDTSGQQTVLYTFPAIPGADGNYFTPGVLRDPAGNLYGANVSGGTGARGVLYKIDAAGQAAVLYAFPGSPDGSSAWGGVTLAHDPVGNLYGTTYQGGPPNAGAVYKLDAAGHETVLYTFTGGADGGNPCSGVVLDSAGNIYGTTYSGGAGTGDAGWGVVYKLDTAGHQTGLHTFTGGADGGHPYSGLTLDAAGNLYGATFYGGGTANAGVAFKLDPAGDEAILYTFTVGQDGCNPWAAPILDSEGNLFGTTTRCGGGAGGVVYKLDPAGQETVLYVFTGGADGYFPIAGVTADAAGNLYGTTFTGNQEIWGAAYKLDKARHLTVLHTFTGGADGGQPYAAPILDPAGNLYGTTNIGGLAQSNDGAGVVYQIDPAGTFTVLHTFTNGADGGYPYAGLIRDSAGNLYCATLSGGSRGNGAVFKLTP
jgi:uncharacterized repeat protein (TIGR03803 family)